MGRPPPGAWALGPFVIEERLGRGAVGEVWRARHRDRGVTVAIKVVAADVAAEEREALVLEARAVAALDHPGIVQVLDLGRVSEEADRASGGVLPAGRPYLVMDLHEGGTLAPEVGRLSWPRLRALLQQVLEALAHAHAHGQVHRDLKPGNVLLDRTGQRAVLTDFGLAALLDAADPHAGVVRGTPAYMAPEQVLDRWRDQGPWTDLYSLGCLAWTLSTGEPPFGRELEEAIRGHALLDPPPLRPAHRVPIGFEAWLRRLLRKAPAERFQHAADAARALQALPDPGWGRRPLAAPSDPTGESTDVLEPLPPPPDPDEVADTAGLPVPAGWRPRDEWLRPDLGLRGTRGLVGIRSLRLVGRDAERDALWAALRQAAAEVRPQVVVLRGAMGVGKSRLARWVGERAHELGCAQVLSATHGPGDAGGIGDAIARSVHGVGLDREGLVQRLRADLGGALSPADLAALAELAGPDPERASPLLLLPDRRNALLVRWLSVRARRRRLVLVLDDVQWSASSVELARTLLDAAPRLPILVLLAAQDEALSREPEAHAALVRLEEAGARRLAVGPLDDRHQHALVAQLLGLAPALAGAVVRRTAGNPRLAEQLVRHWVEADLLTAGEDGLVARPGARLTLPPALVDEWSGRLARLLDHRPAEEGHSLELAAVLGQCFDRGLWSRACALAGIRPAQDRVELMLAERLLRTAEGGGGALCFAHGMVREALLLRAGRGGRRGQWHAAAATALEEAGGDGRTAEQRARHLLEAGAFEAALEPLLDAAWEHLRANRADTAAELVSLRRRALVGLRAAAHDPRHGDQLVLEAWLASTTNRLTRAHKLAEEALELGFAHNWLRTVAGAHRVLGITLRAQGRPRDAERHLRAAARLWRRLRRPLEEARTQRNLADARADLGAFDEARRAYEAALEVHLAQADHDGAAHCHLGLAQVLRQQGELGAAIERLRQARAQFEGGGNRWGEAVCVNDIADIQRIRGELDAAEAGFREARDRYVALGYRPTVPDINRGLVLAERGQHDEAVALLEPLAEAIAASDRGNWLLHVQAGLLRSFVALGRRPEAERALEALERDLAEQGQVDEEIAALAEAAARIGALRGWDDLATWARRLAAAHWRGLGREADAERAERGDPQA